MKELDTLPLYNFLSFLGLRYIAAIIILAAIFSITAETFDQRGSISPLMAILNAVAISAMLLLLAFISYVIYKIYIGDHFRFMPLMVSAWTIIFLASLAVSIRAALSDSSGFHILQVLLPLIASLTMAAIFSAFVKVAQRFISA